MGNMKSVSLRVDNWLDEEFQLLANNCSYRSKSDYMRQALKVFLALTEKEKADYLYNFSPEWGDVVERAEFKYRRDPEGGTKWRKLHPYG